MIRQGARVQVVDRAHEYFGAHGTVTREEHPAVLTGRPSVEVLIDGQAEQHDVGFYVSQVSVEHSLRVVA